MSNANGTKEFYNTWFGRVTVVGDEFKVERSDFTSAYNESKLPFSLKDAGLQIFKSEKDYYKNLRKIAIQIAEKKVLSEILSDERYLITLIKTMDEIDLGLNLFSEKIQELEDVHDTEIAERFRNVVKDLKDLRRRVEEEINKNAEKIMPNVSSIVGGVISARLLEKCGSLRKLSSLPASTIQIIGAEKSLFKAISRMKKGKKAKIPKHGIIFQHPYIRTLPKKKRGKMARFMAGKIAIASRIDHYSGELVEELSDSVREKFKELKEG